MAAPPGKENKTAIMKDIVLQLHQGLSAEEAKGRFEREIGDATSTEIAEMEQSLIDEGLSPDVIKQFCNVHALLFQSALEKATLQETSPSHPVFLFRLKNTEIEKLVIALRDEVSKKGPVTVRPFQGRTEEAVAPFARHRGALRKEGAALFPFLEKKGFTGPSKVMWGKHNEIRGMMKTALAKLEALGGPTECRTMRPPPSTLCWKRSREWSSKRRTSSFPPLWRSWTQAIGSTYSSKVTSRLRLHREAGGDRRAGPALALGASGGGGARRRRCFLAVGDYRPRRAHVSSQHPAP